MQLSGNTVLVTGGASGIGLALAIRFLKAGSKVIICGRREDELEEAQQRYPELQTVVCDVARETERLKLYEWVKEKFPYLNVLVNNAGIQQRVQLAEANEVWSNYQQEIAINLEAPIHLSMLFIPLLNRQRASFILNVTSGLAFSPAAWVPIYSATKAALHSFTLTLRHQLSKTPVKVVEIVPPAVQTDLGGPGLHTFGVPLDDFADAIFERLAGEEQEIGYGMSEKSRTASREELDAIFQRMNS